MFNGATQLLHNVRSSLYSVWDSVDRPCKLRTTIATVAFVALNIFSAYQNENSLWWGFSVGVGIFFHKQIRAGFRSDMSNISWKWLLPSLFVGKAFFWPVHWKVVAVFTGLNTGAYWVEWGHWFNNHKTTPPPVTNET